MSRFPGKVNLSNLIKKKNRPSLVSKRVHVTSTNSEGNLIHNNTSVSNGCNDFNVKSECDSDFNSNLSEHHENGHDGVSTSEKHSSSSEKQQLQATQSLEDNCINRNTNSSISLEDYVNTSNRVSASNNGKCTSSRQDMREIILNSKEMKASNGLSFFQSLANPSTTASASSISPDKSLDEDEDDDKFTFEGFSQDQVDENRRRILQEYELLTTDDSNCSSSDCASESESTSCDNESTSSGSNYANCKSNLDDSTSSNSDDEVSERSRHRSTTFTSLVNESRDRGVKNQVNNINQSDIQTTTATTTVLSKTFECISAENISSPLSSSLAVAGSSKNRRTSNKSHLTKDNRTTSKEHLAKKLSKLRSKGAKNGSGNINGKTKVTKKRKIKSHVVPDDGKQEKESLSSNSPTSYDMVNSPANSKSSGNKKRKLASSTISSGHTAAAAVASCDLKEINAQTSGPMSNTHAKTMSKRASTSPGTNNCKSKGEKVSCPLLNHTGLSSSKRRKDEIISRALIALQSQWRERFLESQKVTGANFKRNCTSGPLKDDLKCNNHHIDDAIHAVINNTSSSSLPLSPGLSKPVTATRDTNAACISSISSTSENDLHSKCDLNIGSSVPSSSILRQPRLQVDQSTLNHIRNAHRHSLDTSSNGSRSSLTSESSSSHSSCESSYGSSTDDEQSSSDAETSSDNNSSNSDASDNFSVDNRKKITPKCSKLNKKLKKPKKLFADSLRNVSHSESEPAILHLKASNVRTSQNASKMIKPPSKKKSETTVTPKSHNENGFKSKKKNPGTITCAICSTVKYYSHKQRRFGQFSCEPCSKFFASFLRSPRAYFCENTGDCAIDTPSGNGRCRACWLKLCLQKFNFPEKVRGQLTENNFLPKLKSEPHVSLIAVDTGNSPKELSIVTAADSIECERLNASIDSTNDSTRNKSNGITVNSKSKKKQSTGALVDSSIVGKKSKSSAAKKQMTSDHIKSASTTTGLLMVAPQRSLMSQGDHNSISSALGGRGPRVKRVCRTTATGLPRATFSSRESGNTHTEHVTSDGDEDGDASDAATSQADSTGGPSSDSNDSDALPVTEYIIRAFKRENASDDTQCQQSKANRSHTTKKDISNGSKNGKKKSKDTHTKSTHKNSSSSFKCIDRNGCNDKKVTPKKKQGQSMDKCSFATSSGKTGNKSKSCQSKKGSAANGNGDSTRGPATTTPVKKFIKKRCGTCTGCTASDCGSCTFCLDKKKFGGPNIIKQACKLRKCTQMISPTH